MSATVKDVMTKQVVAVRTDTSFKDIAMSLREHRVSAFPVLDAEDRVVGVVSEADLLAKGALNLSAPGMMTSMLRHREQAKAAGVTAGDLMTGPPVTIGPFELVTQAARLMYARKVKRLPVIDEAGRLLGIIARSDVLSIYSRPDLDIQREIVGRIMLDTLLTDPSRFELTVKDGIVTVEGTPETAVVGRDMIEEIRHLEGVVSVRDRLSYPKGSGAPIVVPLS